MRAARERVRQLVESPPFQRAIIGLIVVNAVILGLETYPAIMESAGEVLHVVNVVIIGVFVVEIALRVFAYGRRFFLNGWNIFDFLVVVVALIPAGQGSAVLRVLRLLRILRLLSAVRSMRLVVSALGAAIPGIASIGGLLAMVVYVFAVSSTTLFGHLEPKAFGDLWLSTASLFRIMLGDGWPEFVAPIADEAAWIWGYFIVFSVLTSLIVLNLFVAVIVESMDRMKAEELADAVAEDQRLDTRILDELLELRRQVGRLEARIADRGSPTGG
jgi:voltage-gated sodium channel